ncbi:hypothetical protein HS048_33925 [Planomonospora sp. ID91781]|uniref:hypothetical protein n=1 Tax=Planomonospora sp. ID91781 TaxID=2738135 RepID=UPI0018C43B67|nr:hypothetical protein [Planomonospora sp. ID91781]MBG0825686.1 hypothetical protein [Planomonospora sp. ID91781]
MALRFLGKDTVDGGSPTLFDDGDRYVLQGWRVTDPAVLARLDLPVGSTLVEVPKELMAFLPPGTPIPAGGPMVMERTASYVFCGPPITDPAVLAQLDLPGHETVIEIPKAAMPALEDA